MQNQQKNGICVKLTEVAIQLELCGGHHSVETTTTTVNATSVPRAMIVKWIQNKTQPNSPGLSLATRAVHKQNTLHLKHCPRRPVYSRNTTATDNSLNHSTAVLNPTSTPSAQVIQE